MIGRPLSAVPDPTGEFETWVRAHDSIAEARCSGHDTAAEIGAKLSVLAESLEVMLRHEIHHRGQGYVYLRALGIEPPPFWERD